MVEHTTVSRKSINEDRIAICPQFGCETIKRVKPLKLGFLGFGKYPKCKQHHLPLVYVDERIGEIIDASIACLFDKSGLPPENLISIIKDKFPDELNTFINSWIYSVTIGRGAKIISGYMNTLTTSYLKQITKKQLKAIKNDINSTFETIKEGMDEITLQFERLLKHLRIHYEVFVNTEEIKTFSTSLRNELKTWLDNSTQEKMNLMKIEDKQNLSLIQVKDYYDKILNLGTCRCLLGLQPIEPSKKKENISAFDRFSAYFEFWVEKITEKFKKSDIMALLDTTNINEISSISFTEEEVEFLEKRGIDVSKLKTRWAWVNDKQLAIDFYKEVVIPKFDNTPKAHDLDKIGYRGFRSSIKKLGIGVNNLTKAAGLEPYFEEKYAGMSYDMLIEFYHKEIIPHYELNYPVDRRSYLKQGLVSRDYRGFIDRLYKLASNEGSTDNIWANFLKKNGFEPLKEFHYKSKSFLELIDIFVKIIYPDLKKKYNLSDKQAPLKEQVAKDYSGFRTAIRRLGYKLSDIYITLNFKQKFWQLYDKKSYKELLIFFKDIIQPTLLDIYDFSENEAPSYEEVEINYRGFIEALNRHGKKLSDVINDAGYIPRKFSNLGVITHSLMNILLSYCINNCNFPSTYYSEVELFSSSKHRIDGFLFVSISLISFFKEQVKNLYPNIKNKQESEEILLLLRKLEGKQHLLFDFSNAFFKRNKTNSEVIARKIKKYLDYPSSFLVLIGTNWSHLRLIKRLPVSVKYKETYYNTTNVVLISPELLGILLGIKGKYKEYLNEIILNNKNEDIDELKDLYNSLEKTLKINLYSTDKFNKIKEKNTLLRWL